MRMFWSRERNLGMLFLAIWLIATGLTPFVHISFVSMGPVLGLLAIAAGVLLLLRR
jgi:hypothetical protein